MIKTEIFEKHVVEYDKWFDKYSAVFQSEVEALRQMLPSGESHGIEVGLGTGRFAKALGIKEGIEPSEALRELAAERGIEVMDAVAEELPYKDLRFDFVLMASCINYLEDPERAFREAFRVLKHDGVLIVGSIEKDSIIGSSYESKRGKSIFYRQAVFYSTDKLVERLREAGFKKFEYLQTLFNPLDRITSPEAAKQGYGEGSYVVIKAIKK
ncbi:MAG TPA: class I SAM-dependent methyltransferase [Bacteroidia bacterium]|nr:class I SAM-dependent methyltransferase [Bacteroidia bacterium]